jgi:hypothetical protein
MRAISQIDEQRSKLMAFRNELSNGGIGSNYTYSARKIIAEIMVGLDCSRDESQRRALLQLKQAIEDIFIVAQDGPGGVKQIYSDEKEAIVSDERTKFFLGRYDELFKPEARTMRPMPEITRYIINLKSIISQLGITQELNHENGQEI